MSVITGRDVATRMLRNALGLAFVQGATFAVAAQRAHGTTP